MIIDSDTHINEPLRLYETFLEEPYRERRPRRIKDTLGLTRIVLEGRLYPDPRLKQVHAEGVEGPRLSGIRPGATDPKARMEDLDREGVDVQVIIGSLGLFLSTLKDKDFAAAMCRACNDFYADFSSIDTDRLKPMATLPLQDVPASIEELKRATQSLGHRGVILTPNVNGVNLDHPDFYPLYEEIQNFDIPLAIHWGNSAYITGAGTERFDTTLMTHAVGHPFEQMIAVASLITGGILEQFPRLRIAFLESGCGWLPYWLDRLKENWERRAPEVPLMKKDPLEYFLGGNCFISAVSDERMLPYVVKEFGDEIILFGSDYPHTDSKFPNSVRFLRERPDLSDTTKERILTNGARWLGLD